MKNRTKKPIPAPVQSAPHIKVQLAIPGDYYFRLKDLMRLDLMNNTKITVPEKALQLITDGLDKMVKKSIHVTMTPDGFKFICGDAVNFAKTTGTINRCNLNSPAETHMGLQRLCDADKMAGYAMELSRKYTQAFIIGLLTIKPKYKSI